MEIALTTETHLILRDNERIGVVVKRGQWYEAYRQPVAIPIASTAPGEWRFSTLREAVDAVKARQPRPPIPL